MPPFDTIQEVDSTSLKELDSTASCVVEYHWQIEESIDLYLFRNPQRQMGGSVCATTLQPLLLVSSGG